MATFPLTVTIPHVSGAGAHRIRWTLTYDVTLGAFDRATLIDASGIRRDGTAVDIGDDPMADVEFEAVMTAGDWAELKDAAVSAATDLYYQECA